MDSLLFWGILFILVGIVLLLRVIFNIDFPVFKILAGLFLIMLGIKVIFGQSMVWPLKTGENEFFFRSAEPDISGELPKSYHMVFSETIFDLAGYEVKGQENLKINNIFSGCTVYIDSGMPVNIEVDAVFASVKLPGRNTPVFGRGTYSSEGFDPSGPHLEISVNVVFGSIVFISNN